ncbi:elongation factor 1-beta [Candidatus Methanoplasma termitum]|uniref:Elongation factor 1-beta n=1 Tax=Candidatus Methanoplasma termitum TaxID=1577791 RepID=A0A0A7LFI7_9ARCH|nr:elongation factor 1-beta [Candidatus Methanoplasma termitum]AIZ57037.1 elongation factor 1-beta [Candidatus Methanoplasma termitum]MCL2334009.1 elongation factor 1-beta [Candidatus Methanoplasma sp.]
MGQIVAAYDLMPESTEVNLEAVVKKIRGIVPKGVQVLDHKILPVAFGLKKINIGFSINDENETAGSDLENALSSLPGIENIECVSSTLL